jgi:ribosomal protein S18 acetylase RimI-like enzyme
MGEREIEIRPATASDVAAVKRIVTRAYEGYIEQIGRRPLPMDADYESAVHEGKVFVAECAGDTAGLVVLVLEREHVLVENVAVDPRLQHRGVGRALLAFAESYARGHERPVMRLYTHCAMERNQRLYAGLGYEREPPPAGDRTPRVFMVKRLGS